LDDGEARKIQHPENHLDIIIITYTSMDFEKVENLFLSSTAGRLRKSQKKLHL